MTRPEASETASGGRSLLLLDACCVINLLASGEARAIIGALEDVDVAVANLVAEREVVEEGLVSLLAPEGERVTATYVDLALQLDDGEAMTGAIAIHRGGAVATDDKKAIRVLGGQSPAPEIRRTSWLIRTWAEAASVDEERVRSALRNIERRGSFFPPADDPLPGWWRKMTDRD